MFNTATWMGELAATLGPLGLKDVALPGTHDSATYGITPESEFAPDEPSWLHIFDGSGPIGSLVRQITAGWSRTQGATIAEQLDDGIRYIDLRVCQNPEGAFYICHGLYSVPVADVLDQVARFVGEDAHRHEVVILDFNHFYGMSADACQTLADQVTSYLGPKLMGTDTTVDTPLQTLWDAGQQVVVFLDGWQQGCGPDYGPQDPGSEYICACTDFWNQGRVQSCWPNAQSLDELQQTLDREVASDKPADKLWVMQGILTEDAQVVLAGLNPFGNHPSTLEEWAATTTPQVVSWIEGPWAQAGLNIVIVDWYTPEYVQAMIGLNQGR